MHAGENARLDGPFLVAIEVISSDEHFFLVEEADVNSFAVGDRRAGCKAVEAMLAFEGRFENRSLPKDLAGLAIDAEQVAFVIVEQARHGEDSVVPNDGRGMPDTRNLRFPCDVLCS